MFDLVGNDVGHINEVALRWAWMGDRAGINFLSGKLTSVYPVTQVNSAWQSLSGRHNEYFLRQGSKGKAGMARIWWQVKLCVPLYNTSYRLSCCD